MLPRRYSGKLGPPIGTVNCNGLLRIHADNPEFVRRQYETDVLYFMATDGDFSDRVTPNYERTSPMQRSESYLSYAGTDNQSICLTLTFASSVEAYDSGEYPMTERQIRWLKSLCYPSDLDGLLVQPPVCQLMIGRFISRRVVMTAFDCSYPQPCGGINSATDYPIFARINLEFTSVNTRPPRAVDFIPLSGVELTGM